MNTTTTRSRSYEWFRTKTSAMGLTMAEACRRMNQLPSVTNGWRIKGQVPPWVPSALKGISGGDGIGSPKITAHWYEKASRCHYQTDEVRLLVDLVELYEKAPYAVLAAVRGLADRMADKGVIRRGEE